MDNINSENPIVAPVTARGIFCGKIAPSPSSLKTSWKRRVSKMLEDAIVEVSEAPILLRPMTYNNEQAEVPEKIQSDMPNPQFLNVM